MSEEKKPDMESPKEEAPEGEAPLGQIVRKDGKASFRFQLTIKEAVLLHLWGYSGQPQIEPDLKAQIMESHNILKEGIETLRVFDIDKKKGAFSYNATLTTKHSIEVVDHHIGQDWTRMAIATVFGFQEELLKAVTKQDRDPFFKVGRHGVKQLTGKTGPQIAMTFEEAPVDMEDYIAEAGLQVSQEDRERFLEGWGADLTVTQHSVLLAVLERMSAKNYQGDGREDRKAVLTRAGVNPPGGRLPELMEKALRNVKDYPVVRLYLHEVVELTGLDNEAQRDKLEVKQALEHLGSVRYAFYWERLAWTEGKGGRKIPVMDQDKKYVKEGVRTVGSVLYVKQIVDPASGQLDYYEISPSEVFLDQVTEGYGAPGGYFLMMPTGLLEKVRKAVGPGRRVTPHYYTFLYWLLAKYEDRRSKTKKGESPNLQIREHYEQIAQLIRMPWSIWKRKRVKAIERLESIYQAAKDLGYLKSYSMGRDGIVTLNMDPSGPFYRPKKDLELPPSPEG